MPVHRTTDDFHNPKVPTTPLLARTAKCGLVVDPQARKLGRPDHLIWTPAEVSRREDVASHNSHGLKLFYSRLCPDCFPWARDPDFIAGLDAETPHSRVRGLTCQGFATSKPKGPRR